MKIKILLLLILLTTACTLTTQEYNQSGILEPSGSIQAYICPKDNCTQILVREIMNTESSIDCAFYSLREREIIDALKTKQPNLILHSPKNNHAFQHITYRQKSGLMHNKFCIIDDRTVITGSTNPTSEGLKENRNNIVVIRSKQTAENFQREFNEMKNNVFGAGETTQTPLIKINNINIETYFCPEDKCADQLYLELEKAEHNILFMTYSFTKDEIGDILLLKTTENISVRGVFETRQISKYSEYSKLKDKVPVKIYKKPHLLHHKVFIIDNETVITGSFNPSNNADNINDENMLIIHDPEIADKFIEEFESIWKDS